MASNLGSESLDANAQKQKFPLFNLPAELREEIYKFALSTYSGHINILSRRDHARGYSPQANLGPLALLLGSKGIASEIRKIMFRHFTVFIPPRLSGWSFLKIANNHAFRSMIVDLDTYKSPVSVISDLGRLESLEDLEIRTSTYTCWPALVICLGELDLFKNLRLLTVVNLRLLGRSPSSPSTIPISRRPMNDRTIVGEIFSKAILKLKLFENEHRWPQEVVDFEIDAGNLKNLVKSSCPDRKLDVLILPSPEHGIQVCQDIAEWYVHGGRGARRRRLVQRVITPTSVG